MNLLLDNGAASVIATNPNPLNIAAAEGLTSIAKLLLKRGAASQGEALEAAVANQHTATVNVLLARLIFPPAILLRSLTSAAINGDDATVNLLLNFTLDKSSALREAANAGHASTLQLLLDNELNNDINILYTAAQKGRAACVEILINKVNYDSVGLAQALKKAAYYGHTLTVKLLLEHGATLATTSFGLWAAANGHKQVYQYLIAFHTHLLITFPINKLSIHDTNNIILQRPVQHWHNSALNLIYHEDAFLSLVTHRAIAQIAHAKGIFLPRDMLIYISSFLSFKDIHALGSLTLAKVGRINRYLIEQKNPQQQQGFTALSHCLFNYPLKPSASAVKFIKEKHVTMRSGLFSTFTSKARLLANIAESDDELISVPQVRVI